MFLVAVLLSDLSICANVFMYLMITMMAVLVMAETSGVELVDTTLYNYTVLQKVLRHVMFLASGAALIYKGLYFESVIYMTAYTITLLSRKRSAMHK